VPACVAVTVTPGITAPEASRTVPTMDAVSVCAAAGTGVSASARARQTIDFTMNFANTPVLLLRIEMTAKFAVVPTGNARHRRNLQPTRRDCSRR
jgi:hypothetical protein